MDLSALSNVFDLFRQIIKWRKTHIISDKVEFHWNDLHLSIVQEFSFNLCMTCDLTDLHFASFFNGAFRYTGPGSSMIRAKMASSFTLELRKFFMVPRLNKFYESQNRIKKYHLIQAFLSFLLQLLYHKPDLHFCRGPLDNLEKNLRFLLTIIGDTSLVLCDEEHEEFQKLLADFEAVANEAGILIHSFFFSTDAEFRKMDQSHGGVVDHIDSLKENIMKFLHLFPSIRRSACITSKTSVLDSLLIVDSLLCDLNDLMKQENNRTGDVKAEIELLHQRLMLFQSSIRGIGSPHLSEIGGFKEPLMRIGHMAREAEYLINSFLVGDAPLWYLINRLNDVNHEIGLTGIDLGSSTRKFSLIYFWWWRQFSDANSGTQLQTSTTAFEAVFSLFRSLSRR